MFTNKARLLVTVVFVVLMVVAIYMHIYQIAVIALMFVVFLVIGYFKEGPIILAAKYYHKKDYTRSEELLKQIRNPEWLSKKRRGFYEFILGGISLQRQDYNEAERHYEIAAQYPLRSVNDHVAALVHVANISIRQGNYEKAKVYIALAVKHEDKITAKMKAIIERLQEEVKKNKN